MKRCKINEVLAMNNKDGKRENEENVRRTIENMLADFLTIVFEFLAQILAK